MVDAARVCASAQAYGLVPVDDVPGEAEGVWERGGQVVVRES